MELLNSSVSGFTHLFMDLALFCLQYGVPFTILIWLHAQSTVQAKK